MSIQLDGMIRQYRATEDTAERARLNAAILERYSITASLMVLDMSGFSKITEARGIVHFLAMVQQMQDITGAQIERFNGQVVKFFSDNCFAFFTTAENAVDCAIAVMKAHHKLNESLELPVHICIGIDHGEFLLIDGGECFGHTVNRACKLGEDIAQRGEILVSARTLDQIPGAAKYPREPRKFQESGIDIDAYLLNILD